MPNGVLTAKRDATYDDLPEFRYHFPRMYLKTMERLVGQMIVYYEPRRNGGRQSYFATARVEKIDDDPDLDGHYYARIDQYLDFDTLVPWRSASGAFETNLLNADGSTNAGPFQRAIREIPEYEFEAILAAGFHLAPWEAAQTSAPLHGVAEETADFERPMVQQTLMRPFRDQVFRRTVRQAYNHTCAVTGIELRNGLGRPEVEAAHIRPVERQGTDATRNGVALSGTVHWMFDRGLISVGDDLSILIASSGLPEKVRGLFNPSGKLHVPADPALHPHPDNLRFHRENIFKQ